MMKVLIKNLVKALLGEYGIYYIFSLSAEDSKTVTTTVPDLTFTKVEKSEVENCDDSSLRAQSFYHGPETFSFACLKYNTIIGLCYCWHGNRYQKRNFWSLSDEEAKIVQLVISPKMRDQGLGTILLQYSAHQVLQNGFKRVYGRIWHSNTPSLKAAQKAGWVRVGTVIELNPFRRKIPLRIRLKTGK